MILFVLALGMWLVYIAYRSLRIGSIKYSILFSSTYERNSSPFWYWFYTMVAGCIGVGLVIVSIVFAFTRL
jgi:hypothetical protein